jgi:hypothetical protein
MQQVQKVNDYCTRRENCPKSRRRVLNMQHPECNQNTGKYLSRKPPRHLHRLKLRISKLTSFRPVGDANESEMVKKPQRQRLSHKKIDTDIELCRKNVQSSFFTVPYSQ